MRQKSYRVNRPLGLRHAFLPHEHLLKRAGIYVDQSQRTSALKSKQDALQKAYTGLPVVRVYTKTEGTELGGIELQGSS